jgi:hypothetical protein
MLGVGRCRRKVSILTPTQEIAGVNALNLGGRSVMMRESRWCLRCSRLLFGGFDESRLAL